MAENQAIKVPDIGGAIDVDVIEILVKEGDEINEEVSLVTLESDKASMEIPSPVSGVVQSIQLKVGDKVSEGDVILFISSLDAGVKAEPEPKQKRAESNAFESQSAEATPKSSETVTPSKSETPSSDLRVMVDVPAGDAQAFAGPAVRRFARELGVSLSEVQGTGRKSRILKEDIEQYVKAKLNERGASGFSLPQAPEIDFSQFGEIEVKPLNKIKRLTGSNLHRAWVTVPHVTQFDEADITELEAFRKSEAEQANAEGLKLTLLAFVCKVVARALAFYPQFNASLDAAGENLIYKHYVNIGVAVETPNGLVVPVIQGVDQLSVKDVAKEMARLSMKARKTGLMPGEMKGGCFTISSLGGIGGTAFTPIVNTPEVAILGLSRSVLKPVFQAGEFKPRLMLPLSLSYDHRVIDGAEAARFTRFLAEHLSEIRKIIL